MEYSSKARKITSQPTPRLITEGGTGVALPYLAAAIKEPVDCTKISRKNAWNVAFIGEKESEGEFKTSTRATNEATMAAKVSPAVKVGGPHWKGNGM